jgi:hypothetical protein
MTDPDPANRREHERTPQKGYISVTVVESPEAPLLEGVVFRCTTRDLSSNGLKMVVHSYVPVDTMLQLKVEFVDPVASFEHTARVSWCREQSHDIVQSYALGMRFVDTQRKRGHEDWDEMIRAHMLGAKAPPL